MLTPGGTTPPCPPETSLSLTPGGSSGGSAGTGLHLDAVADGGDDLRDRLGGRDAVLLRPVAVAEGPPSLGHVVVARDQHVRDLLPLRAPDLLLHPVIARDDVDPDAVAAQLVRGLRQVRHVRLGDRD